MHEPKAEPPDNPQLRAQTLDKSKTITKENRENIRDKNEDDAIHMEHLNADGDGIISSITS